MPKFKRFFLISFLFPIITSAQLSTSIENVYSLGGFFDAYFGGEPKIVGNVNNKDFSVIGYKYLDFANYISYSATHLKYHRVIAGPNGDVTLKDFISGGIASLGGTIIKQDKVQFSDTDAIITSYQYVSKQGDNMRTYNIVSLNNEVFCSWSVHEVVGKNKKSAKDIFNEKLKYYELRKSAEVKSTIGNNIFTIGGYFNAYFKEKPEFIGNFNNKDISVKSFRYWDPINQIGYHGTYDISYGKFKRELRKEALLTYLYSQIDLLDGALISERETEISGYDAIIFSFVYNYDGTDVLKNNAVILTGNVTCSWAVQGIVGTSDESATKIFNEHLKSFKISN